MTMQEKSIKVVIPSYKNKDWYQKNLDSVFAQKYSNFKVLYTDDCSPDNTGNLVEEHIAKRGKQNLVILNKNQKRIGAMQNLYNMIHSCNNDDIVITLDGDDWFAHPNVLNRINKAYQDPNTWMTYGQYRSYPDNRIGCSRQIPANVIQNNIYRTSPWCSSHLRTFYAWLFKKIKKEDLMHGSEFYPMAWDLAMMFPMLEMSGPKAKFLSDVTYIYNVATPLNDSKVNLQLQQNLERVIRAKAKYSRIVV